jgi:hypothetical protein
MLANCFDSGTSGGDAPVRYLLGNKDHKGSERSVKPKLFRGDPESTKDLIDSINNKQKYTSGVLAFRENEVPSVKQMHQICDEFERYMFGGLSKDRVNILWVLHKDKGRPELHFVVPKIDLKSGKQLNISPPGKQNQDYYRLFGAYINDKFGWEQVSPKKKWDLKAAEYKSETVPALYKRALCKQINNNYETGMFKDRNDLIKWLEQNKIQVLKQADDFITIGVGGNKLRMYGEIFKQNPDMSVGKPYVFNQHEKNRLEHYRVERVAYFDKRFNTPPKPRFTASPQGKTTVKPQVFQTVADRIKEREVASMVQNMASIGGDVADVMPKEQKPSSGVSSGGGSSGGADTSLQKVALSLRRNDILRQLIDATPSQVAELQNELTNIDIALGRLKLQEMEEAGREMDKLYELYKKPQIDEAPT